VWGWVVQGARLPEKKVYFDDFQDFALYLERQEKENIVKKLATLNLGGLYAEEICARAGVDKDSTKVGDREMKRLFTKYNELFELHYAPNMVKGNPVPFDMESLGEGEAQPNYNTALNEYYKQFIPDEEAEEEEQRLTKKEKLDIVLREQEKNLEVVEKSIVENKEKGDWIYANYVEVKEYLDLYKQNKVEVLKRKGVEVEGTSLLITT